MTDTKLIKALVKGAITYLPGFSNILDKKRSKSIHSCANAGFCYNLWLHILVHLKENEGKISFLKRIGEIGNGGSFGVGICALLTGSKEYYALEIEGAFNVEQNLVLLERLCS